MAHVHSFKAGSFSLCNPQIIPSALIVPHASHSLSIVFSGGMLPFAKASARSEMIFMVFSDLVISSAKAFPLSPFMYWVIAAGVNSIFWMRRFFVCYVFGLDPSLLALLVLVGCIELRSCMVVSFSFL